MTEPNRDRDEAQNSTNAPAAGPNVPEQENATGEGVQHFAEGSDTASLEEQAEIADQGNAAADERTVEQGGQQQA